MLKDKSPTSKTVLDSIVQVRCEGIAKIFIKTVGSQLGSRAKPLWLDWKKSHNRYRNIPLYIDSLAAEIEDTSLRNDFYRNANEFLAANVNKRDASEFVVSPNDKIKISDKKFNPITMCINGEGL